MATARFRFHGELGDFLPRERREAAFDYACARAATLKNAIEALGVPHTEAALVLVNGQPATLARIVREGDAVEVWPWEAENRGQTAISGAPEPPEPRQNCALCPVFVADAHLGGLARFLRMLGYDTVHGNNLPDAEIRRLAWQERRIVLTRDRELLKCREIARGCYVHARKPEAQLREVAARYDLAAQARPFTLCLICNLPLSEIEKSLIERRLPPEVAARHHSFRRCAGCERLYWPGSHYARMRSALAGILR
jgi:hypothetical protein